MATITAKTSCVKCKKIKNTLKCSGCSQDFCFDHIAEHRNELSEQLSQCEDQFNEVKIKIDEQKSEPQKNKLMKQIDRWEIESIEKIQQMANEIRFELSSCIIKFVTDLDMKLKQLTKQIIQCRKEDDFSDIEIKFFNEELKRLKDILNNPTDFKIEQESTTFINKIHLTHKATLLRDANVNTNAKWIQNGITIAGGNGQGNALNQLASPHGLCIDNDQTVYIADCWNHRIMEWKPGATTGRVVAGGNGQGNHSNQLNYPADVIIDKKRNSLIICDYNNKRVVRWPLQNSTHGETIISNIGCLGLTMDDDEFLYIVDKDKHEVRRYRMEENQETVVAGGNGQGNRLDQLSSPTYIFVDQDHSVFVSDYDNHRVMKWMEGKKQGIVVAGGQGQGNSLSQLSHTYGIIVDQSGTLYVADRSNDRIMCWSQGATQGNVIIGENGQGCQLNQLSVPIGLQFDREGNLYVCEFGNNRVQKFNINQS
ncbi:unnamed protein product [Rotaria sp. Silwood1]|nr:unnamed protein product [Rotaria sp. Silwood1]CAF1617279.1 unnamed protein product [Rotaria sp. Silwood1]CAF3664983.1 unnamed protein product [Rotaria sp. Silwood1]CAF3761075.1 unnamed protein product [Rotaria sp. Silwood1]CAF4618327.1 unnamed protein product [Rotaria sp. Silwood1]